MRFAPSPAMRGFPLTSSCRSNVSPGFRNIVIHEYVALDLDRVVAALGSLEPVHRFIEIVRQIEST